MFERRLTSQPSSATPLQSYQPLAQETTLHLPAEHVAVAFGSEHAPPQTPQLARSVSTFVSQPLAGTPSQSPYPVRQLGVHLPASQDVLPWALEQGKSQRPQCKTSLLNSASHPFVGYLSQSPQPDVHVIEQTPASQDGVPFAILHGLEHPPQLKTSRWTFVSQPLSARLSQSLYPEPQSGAAHSPPLHT